jgi:6-pyruvoyltetrahydropterin/6-carboxytetrahydropterin synthase
MVMDFGELKRLMMEHIHAPLDHGFMAWRGDDRLVAFLQAENYRLIVMDDIPTGENLARWCFDRLLEPLILTYGDRLKLVSVTVWETPNNCAVYTPVTSSG